MKRLILVTLLFFLSNLQILLAQRSRFKSIQKEFLLKIYGTYDDKSKKSKWLCKDPQILKSLNVEKLESLLESQVFYIDTLLEKKKVYVFIKSNPEGFNCHSCAPVLSIAEFSIKDDLLELISLSTFAAMGNYGFPPEIKPILLNENVYSFLIKSGFTAQGINVESIKIYSYQNNQVNLLLNIPNTYEDNDGICDPLKNNCWKYESIINTRRNNEFAEIILNKKGKRSFSNRIVNFDSTYVYVFNGINYSLKNRK